jgi:hypothetical protein
VSGGGPNRGIGELRRRMAVAVVTGTRRSPAELRRLATRGPARNLLAAQIFAGMAREFDGRRGADLDAVVRWEVGPDERDVEVWDLVLRGGRCRVSRDAGEEPRTVIGLDHETLLELAVGMLNAPQAYIAGRLRMRGDVMLAQRLSALFSVPGAGGRR